MGGQITTFFSHSTAMTSELTYAELHSQEFRGHFERMFIPLKPGLRHVRSEAFVREEFELNSPEVMELFRSLRPEVLHRARSDAKSALDQAEESMRLQLEHSAAQFMRDPNIFGGQNCAWNARNADEMQENLSGFCDMNIRIWEENYLESYTAFVNSEFKDHEAFALVEYVKRSVSFALASVPYHLEEGEEEIYYDSESTAEFNDPVDPGNDEDLVE